MKICLLSDKYVPEQGGLAISAHRLARGLLAAGHRVQVCVVSRQTSPDTVQAVQVDAVPVIRVGAQDATEDTLAHWFEVVKALHAEQGFDLLHGYYAVGAGFVAAYAGRYLDVPAIVSVRGNDIDRALFKPEKASHILWALTHASAVTAVTTHLARSVQALAPGQRVEVIFNSVDTDFFAPAPPDPYWQEQYKPTYDTALVGFVGEARLKKGLATLLTSFERVRAVMPRCHLLLIGGVRRDAKEMFRTWQTRFPHVPISEVAYVEHARLPGLYNTLDLVVLPSLRDGMPNALLEAMACARPVVASSVGGMPDVIVHGENGWLVPPGDVGALTSGMLHLLHQPDEGTRLGRSARAHILNQFERERELGANLALYHQVLSSRA